MDDDSGVRRTSPSARRLIVATAVVRLDDLVVLRNGGRVLAAHHIEPVRFAVVDERLLHWFSGRPRLVVERAAWHVELAGRLQMVVLCEMVHRHDAVLTALVTAAL